MTDLPSGAGPELVACSVAAADHYRIPAPVVLAVATLEGGKPGLRKKNTDGSSDIGPLQFNTRYLRSLAQYGITEEHVAEAGCYPYRLAAWRLRGHLLRDVGDPWTRAANFHSRTERFNRIYREKLIVSSQAWTAWLARSAPSSSIMTTSLAPAPSTQSRLRAPYIARTITASGR